MFPLNNCEYDHQYLEDHENNGIMESMKVIRLDDYS